MGSGRWLVVSLFVSGCLGSAVYICFSFPLLIPHVCAMMAITSPRAFGWLASAAAGSVDASLLSQLATHCPAASSTSSSSISFQSNSSLASSGTVASSTSLLSPTDTTLLVNSFGLCGLRDHVTLVCFALLGFMVLWSFIQAASVDPGRPPAALHQTSPKASSLSLRWFSSLHACPSCCLYKPPRTHHCSRCKRCVLKYDHHCPWIGQCVGFFNYKLYLLFVWYTHLFTVFITFTLGGSVLRRVSLALATGSSTDGILDGILDLLATLPIGSTAASFQVASWPVVVTYLLALVFQLLTLYLIPVHWRQARHNITTVEHVIRGLLPEEEQQHWVNPFDVGVDNNMAAIFGDGAWAPAARRHSAGADSDADDLHHRVKIGVWQWVLRCLPIEPYPPQSRDFLTRTSMEVDIRSGTDSDGASAQLLHGKGCQHLVNGTTTYGSTAPVVVAPGHAGELHSHHSHHHKRHRLASLLADDRMLGMVFPTDSQRMDVP